MTLKTIHKCIEENKFDQTPSEINNGRRSDVALINSQTLQYRHLKLKIPLEKRADLMFLEGKKRILPTKHIDNTYLLYTDGIIEDKSKLKIVDLNHYINLSKSEQSIANLEESFIDNPLDLHKYIEDRYDTYLQRNNEEYMHIQPFKVESFPYKYLTEFKDAPLTRSSITFPSISLIYAIKNRYVRTHISLNSLFNALTQCFRKNKFDRKSVEIIIIEDESSDTLPNLSDVSGVFCVRHYIVKTGKNWSRAGLLNFGIKKAKNDLIGFLDSDFLFPKDFFIHLHNSLYNLDLQQSVLAVNCYETEVHLKGGMIHSALSPYGYMWMVSKQNCEVINGFDEAYQGHGFEDRDFQFRLSNDLRLSIISARTLNPELAILHFSHNFREGVENRKNNEARYRKVISGEVNRDQKKMWGNSSLSNVIAHNRDMTYYFINHKQPGEPNLSSRKLMPIFDTLGIKLLHRTAISSIKGRRRILLVDDSPSSLDLYRTKRIKITDIVIQLISQADASESPRRKTIIWLRKLGFNVYGMSVDHNQKSDSKWLISLDQIGKIKCKESRTIFFSRKLGIDPEKYYKEIKARLKYLEINFIDEANVIEKVRENNRYYKSLEVRKAQDDNMTYPSFPRDLCPLYLKNKYYNATGTYENDISKVEKFFAEYNVHRNYFAEMIANEQNRFMENPSDFLKIGSTVVFLDPTCYDQESGISSYLVNLYKFFKMSRLAEQTLFIKNPFSSAEKQNRESFRKLVRDFFNPQKEFSDKMVFFDSEAHYPGVYLDKIFKKICTTHCSSLLAAKFDGKLSGKLSDGLSKIIEHEVQNIKNSDLIITPTMYHDKVQQCFYAENLYNFDGYKTKRIVNYIHDEYLEFRPYNLRYYDLIFIGRPQKLKGFDTLLEIARSMPQLKIAIVTNTVNEMTNIFESLPNIKVFLNMRKDQIYELLRNSKLLIDFSPHHSCSTVLLEALNAKTPSVLRDLPTYHEVLGTGGISNLHLFLTEKEIKYPEMSINKIIDHLRFLEEKLANTTKNIDALFNDFLLKNYIEHYHFYKDIFYKLGLSSKRYMTSMLFNKYVSNKKIINVVHSPSLTNDDGLFIDSFDLVVRFNRSLERSNSMKHGGRTDILYSCINRSPESGNMIKKIYDEIIKPSCVWVVKTYPNLNWKGWFSFNQDHRAGATYDNYIFETFNDSPNRSSEFSLDWYKIIEANIKSRPNTGILSILDLIQYNIRGLYLKGYTFFKGGYDQSYRKQNEEDVLTYMKQAGHHNQYKQNLFIRKIILTEHIIEVDKTLRSILNTDGSVTKAPPKPQANTSSVQTICSPVKTAYASFAEIPVASVQRKKGNEVLVIGNGFSLRNMEFQHLRAFKSIGMNAAYRHWKTTGIYPIYYICLDTVVIESLKDEIYELIQKRVENGIQLFFLRKNLLNFYPELNNIPEVLFFEDYFNSPYFEGITHNLTTGSFSALLAAMLGYKRVYLLGIDINYVQQIPEAKSVKGHVLEITETPSKNPNYFFDDYQRKGDRFNVPDSTPDLHYQSWVVVKERLERFGVHVLNCNPNSRLDIFDYADINEVLPR